MSDFGQAKFRCLDNFSPSKYFVYGFKFFLSKTTLKIKYLVYVGIYVHRYAIKIIKNIESI